MHVDHILKRKFLLLFIWAWTLISLKLNLITILVDVEFLLWASLIYDPARLNYIKSVWGRAVFALSLSATILIE